MIKNCDIWYVVESRHLLLNALQVLALHTPAHILVLQAPVSSSSCINYTQLPNKNIHSFSTLAFCGNCK